MLVPGLAFGVNNRVRIQSAADPTPSYFYGGFGFNSEGRLCIATGAVDAADSYVKGFRVSPKGAIRGINSAAVDHYIGPYSFSSTDQLAFENAVPARFADGVGFPSTGAGRLQTINS